jgi:hypothetical protein
MAEANARTGDRRRLELTRYICFTVSFSFLPLGCFYIMRAYDGFYLTIPQLVENGAALNIVITLAAESFSQLVASGKKWRELKSLAVAFWVVVIVFGSIFYAMRYARSPQNPTFFVDFSVTLLACSVVSATICRLLPEGDS